MAEESIYRPIGGSSPQAKLTEGTPAHHLASLLRASFLLDQRHIPIKRQDFSMQPLDRHVLDQRRVLVDFEELLWRIDQEHDVLSGKSLLDGVGFLIDLDAAIGADATRKGVPVNALEPAIRIDRFGDCWQFGQGRKGHARWLILARATLMRPFIVVMLHEALSHFTYLLQGGRPMHLYALLLVASMISLDKGIFIWAASAGKHWVGCPDRARSGEMERENHGHWHCRPIWD